LSTRLSLTGQEYYVNGFTSTNGIGFLLGVNRDNNRQLWICDTAKTAQNTTNSVFRVVVGGTSESGIDAVATDGLTRHSLSIGGDALRTDANSWGSLRKFIRFHGVEVADDVATMNNLIFNQGAFAGGVFAGDNFLSSYWGLSILMNSGGNSIPNSNLGRGYDGNYASFTINVRTGATAAFDKKLFTIRGNGVMILTNDVWHITNDNINRFYFAPNGTTYLCSGGAATDNGLVVYSSAATGYNSNLVIKNNGRTGIQNTNPQSMLHLGNCEVNGSAPVILFGKNNGPGVRNAFLGYSESFYFLIGDFGGTNSGSNTLTQQLAIHYGSPALSILVDAAGYVRMQYGYGQYSDERVKTNIKTIENALDKTLLLRGVEYNDFRIEPERKRIGLIAQEVELIVPEVVRTNEEDGMKSIEYQNLVGLLVEAIKDQQKQINELKNILKNNNLY
jgi:hypothetical protein